MAVIDNLLPNEAPLGSFYGAVVTRLAREGVPVGVLAIGFQVSPHTIRAHCYRAQSDGSLTTPVNEGWPQPLNKIRSKNDLPHRKPTIRSKHPERRRAPGGKDRARRVAKLPRR